MTTFTISPPPADTDDDTPLTEWRVASPDGLWMFTADEDETFDGFATVVWGATYLPTRQSVYGYPTRSTVEEGTATGRLLSQLRGEAHLAAYSSPDPKVRLLGQRQLAVHLRLEGADTADAVCQCGGLITYADPAGTRWVHIDACRECWTAAGGFESTPCPDPSAHRFCAEPAPAGCCHGDRNGCTRPATPNEGVGCGSDGSGNCCLGCCNGE